MNEEMTVTLCPEKGISGGNGRVRRTTVALIVRSTAQ